jgi:hypothetical protein
MKKIIASLTLTTLLFGCFGSGPADPTQDDTTTPVEAAEVTLTDAIFIALSAEILCLPTNNPEANADEVETLAKGILTEGGVSEEAFSIYQQTIEADAESKSSLSLAIVGKMSDFCTLIEGGEEEGTETPEDSADLENQEEEAAADDGDGDSDPLAELFTSPPE